MMPDLLMGMQKTAAKVLFLNVFNKRLIKSIQSL
jgi:hypothetical protein